MVHCNICEPNVVAGEKQGYILISGTSPAQYMCNDCFGKPDPMILGGQVNHLPMYQRWKCALHGCGSYNFNNLRRHEMPWCEIIIEDTVGIIKPKTFGGYNGDVSRHYFKDWQATILERERAHNIALANQRKINAIPTKQSDKYAHRTKRLH